MHSDSNVIGKTFYAKGDLAKRCKAECVGITPKGKLILESIYGNEFIALHENWAEVKNPKIVHRYATILQKYGGAEIYYSHYRTCENNVKFTFTDGKLTNVLFLKESVS